jgi:hypothetical protein
MSKNQSWQNPKNPELAKPKKPRDAIWIFLKTLD